MSEIWKNIDGYENVYQVSNFGRIKSLNYKRTGKEQILKPTPNNKGYVSVELYCCKNKYRYKSAGGYKWCYAS